MIAVKTLQSTRLRAKHYGQSSRLVFIAAFTLVTGCHFQSPTEKIARRLKMMASWAATAALVGDAWMANAVPQEYTLRTLREARQQLHENLKILQSYSFPPEAQRGRSDSPRRLESTVRRMIEAVQQAESSALVQPLHQLAEDRGRLVILLTQLTGTHE